MSAKMAANGIRTRARTNKGMSAKIVANGIRTHARTNFIISNFNFVF